MKLQFNTEADEHGMVDGLALAAELLAEAVRLINPYVDNCPACLGDVFSQLATTAIKEVEEAGLEGERDPAILYCFADPEHVDDVIRDALEAAEPKVAALMGLPCGGLVHH